MDNKALTLGERLGVTVHISPLRYRLESLARAFPLGKNEVLEDWLVRVANARGARIVTAATPSPHGRNIPSVRELPDEELAVALVQLQCLDRPQMLRLAAQIVSRGNIDLPRLILAARRERVERIFAELARQALRVSPSHPLWESLQAAFGNAPSLREPLLHWTRIAQPVMKSGRCNAERWELVA